MNAHSVSVLAVPARRQTVIPLPVRLDVAYPTSNALTETSSQGPREQREPPEAAKAALRPDGEDTPEQALNEAARWLGQRAAKVRWHSESALLARISQGITTESQED